MKSDAAGTTFLWPVGLIVSLFFLWGAAASLNDVLIKQFTKAFSLLAWQAGLVQGAFYVGYLFGAMPAAIVARKFGFKASVILGLGLFTLGSLWFLPVARYFPSYPAFLAGLYIIAFGLAFLETAANPWIIELGSLYGSDALSGSDYGTKALNVAQAFNPLGSMMGVFCGRVFILDGSAPPMANGQATPSVDTLDGYQRQQAEAVGLPYFLMAVVVGLVACAFIATSFPSGNTGPKTSQQTLESSQLALSCSRLLRQGSFVQAVIAEFFYVASQVSIWSFTIQYAEANIPGLTEKAAADCLLLSLFLFMAGRFMASALLNLIKAEKLLCIYAVVACMTCATAACMGGIFGVACICATSVFMSMMYPTIFSLALAGVQEEDREVASSMVVMSIVGGAVAPPVMGAVSDAVSITKAYLVPAICFLVVAFFAVNAIHQGSRGEMARLNTASGAAIGRPTLAPTYDSMSKEPQD